MGVEGDEKFHGVRARKKKEEKRKKNRDTCAKKIRRWRAREPPQRGRHSGKGLVKVVLEQVRLRVSLALEENKAGFKPACVCV